MLPRVLLFFVHFTAILAFTHIFLLKSLIVRLFLQSDGLSGNPQIIILSLLTSRQPSGLGKIFNLIIRFSQKTI